jgi:opacity protein-like surface antigen
MKRTVLVGLLALAGATAAAAAEPVAGWRGGLAAAFGSFDGNDVPGSELGDGFVDDNTVGFKAHVQYRFNERFAVEGAFHHTNDFKERVRGSFPPDRLELAFDGFSLQGVVFMPLGAEGLQGFVKAGYFDFDVDLSDASGAASSSLEQGVAASGGVLFEITERIGVRGEYEWYDIDVGDLWSVNLGVEYRFGQVAP